MEYYSFDRVLKELQMGEDELKRLVSEGEIRAFRDEDKMKFKKSDIEGLKKGRMTEPTIILPSGAGEDDSHLDDESSEVLLVEDDTSETLLDIDELDDEDDSSSSTSVPTVDFSVDETGSETLTEELVFDDDSSAAFDTDDLGVGGQETFIDDDTGMTTEPIQLIDEDDDEEDSMETMAAPPPISRGGGGGGRRPRMAGDQEAAGSPIMSAVLVLTAIVMLYGGFIIINLIQEEDNQFTGWLTDIVAGQFPITKYDPESGAEIRITSEAAKEKYVGWRQNYRLGKMDPLPVSDEPSGPGDEE